MYNSIILPHSLVKLMNMNANQIALDECKRWSSQFSRLGRRRDAAALTTAVVTEEG